jgi:hypothetical protein
VEEKIRQTLRRYAEVFVVKGEEDMRCPPRSTVQARRRFRKNPVAAAVVVVSVIKEWVMSKSLLVRIAFCASIFVLLVGIVGLALWLGATCR